jgi:hypothetical protein
LPLTAEASRLIATSARPRLSIHDPPRLRS